MVWPEVSSAWFTTFFTAWLVFGLAGLWIAAVIWAVRDVRRRSRSAWSSILTALLVAVLAFPGLIIYILVRPFHTLEAEYQQSLQEEALLHSLDTVSHCPGCSRNVKDSWQVCPTCHTRLKKTCQACGKLLELPWQLCPNCTTPVPGQHLENISLEEAISQPPVEVEAGESETV
jgi:hypothetical protein